MLHLHAADFEGAAQDVLKNKSPKIPNVGRTINRGTTAIHPEDVARGFEQERAQLPTHGIVQENGHVRVKMRIIRKSGESELQLVMTI
jgi:hypothetical protein